MPLYSRQVVFKRIPGPFCGAKSWIKNAGLCPLSRTLEGLAAVRAPPGTADESRAAAGYGLAAICPCTPGQTGPDAVASDAPVSGEGRLYPYSNRHHKEDRTFWRLQSSGEDLAKEEHPLFFSQPLQDFLLRLCFISLYISGAVFSAFSGGYSEAGEDESNLCFTESSPYRQSRLGVALSEVVPVLRISHEAYQVGSWLAGCVPLGTPLSHPPGFPFWGDSGLLWWRWEPWGSSSVDRILGACRWSSLL